VRELKNAVSRALALGSDPSLGADAPADFHRSREQANRAFEKSYLVALLEQHRGSMTAAAREAGIHRSYLYRLLEQHGIALPKPGGRRRGPL
jgi:transcriptional regulator of acetoin/glycerol metabolism